MSSLPASSSHPHNFYREPLPALHPAFQQRDPARLDWEEMRQRRSPSRLNRGDRGWRQLLNSFRREPAATPPFVPPTIRIMPSPPSNPEREIQEVLRLLLPHVSWGEPVVRRLVTYMAGEGLLPQLIGTLELPLSAQQIEEIEEMFPRHWETMNHLARILSNSHDPRLEVLLNRFRDFIVRMTRRPVLNPPPPVPPPSPEDGPRRATRPSTNPPWGNRLSRLNQGVRNLWQRERRDELQQDRDDVSDVSDASSEMSALGPARPAAEQWDEPTTSFPIDELRVSRFTRHIVEHFACTGCGSAIPAFRTQASTPQVGLNLHVRCSNIACNLVFCKGCHRSVAGCGEYCDARHRCGLKHCCSDIRAMAIFEHLAVFDEDYLIRVQNFHNDPLAQGDAARLAFLAHVFDPAYSRRPQFRGFISILRRTLKYVCFWLMPNVRENIVCSSEVHQMLATSLLLEAVRVFLTRGIETLGEFRLRGFLIQRIVELVLILYWQSEGPLHELIVSPPVAVDQSPGLRQLILEPDSVWEGHVLDRDEPGLLENMQSFWRGLEQQFGEAELQHTTNEFDVDLYNRGLIVSQL